ncbi:MarR family winged helix-turn-helix transcriptional regulator [Thiofilum flexile]|uniref:MarR family winged helix-turn-helix transcriptional regulator n=1 Tax=Thiofilum flexile TaxID=125627 RepID=UPI0003A385D8|nr:MarR family transcriptional regulator [Thiofilum flexile]
MTGNTSTVQDPVLERFLTYRLHLINKLTDKASNDAYMNELGLPVGAARCLAAIGSFAPLSVKDLATHANLNKAQASRATQALLERGYVLKSNNEQDARGVIITLTPSGQAIWQQIMHIIERRNQEVFGCLTLRERQQLSLLLNKLIKIHAQLEE